MPTCTCPHEHPETPVTTLNFFTSDDPYVVPERGLLNEQRAAYDLLIGRVANFDFSAAAWMGTPEACRLAVALNLACTGLATAFLWDTTPQGHSYWRDLNTRMDNVDIAHPLSEDYLALVARVHKISPAGAEYMLNLAPGLASFKACDNLDSAFTWSKTSQGSEYWSELHRMLTRGSSGKDALARRMATWPQPPVWRDGTKRLGATSRRVRAEGRDLVDCYVKAHLREPDRIDILGDLSQTLRERPDILVGKMTTRLPVLLTYNLHHSRMGFNVEDNWTYVEWAMHANSLPQMYGHMVHVSVNDPIKVAYTKTVKEMVAGTPLTLTTPGRYLKKYYPYLTELQIKGYAEAHLAEHTPIKVKIARSASEIVYAIGEGPSSSCMSNKFYTGRPHWFSGHVHPAAVYGHCDTDPTWDTDIEVLYFEKGGEVKARVICNAVTKACARIYGDADKLRPAIKEMGYTQEDRALVGARIRNIANENGNDSYIIPYIDAGTGSGGGNLYYTDAGTRHWMIGTSGMSSYKGYENQGISSSRSEDDEDEDNEDYSNCDQCGDRTHSDNMNSTYDGDGDYVCDHCLNRHYTYVTGRHGDTTYVSNDEAVRCESDGDYYDQRWLSDNDVYEATNGNYYKSDDLVGTMEGESYVDECRGLDVHDVDGNAWAGDSEITTTHDGRVIREDESWMDHFTLMVYHDDDEFEEDEFGETDEVLGLRMEGGRRVHFTQASMLANVDRFYVRGSVLGITFNAIESAFGPEPESVSGDVSLTEYLLTNGGDTSKLGTGYYPDLATNLTEAIAIIYNRLINPKEVTDHKESLAA